MKAHGLERRIKQGSLASAWKPEPESPGLCEGLAPTILFLLVSLELFFTLTGRNLAALSSKPCIQLHFENLKKGSHWTVSWGRQ